MEWNYSQEEKERMAEDRRELRKQAKEDEARALREKDEATKNTLRRDAEKKREKAANIG